MQMQLKLKLLSAITVTYECTWKQFVKLHIEMKLAYVKLGFDKEN